MRWAGNSFYVWGVGLTLAMVMSTRALVLSHLDAGAITCIVLVSMGCCAIQFVAGRRLGAGRDSGASGASGASGLTGSAGAPGGRAGGTTGTVPRASGRDHVDSLTAGQALGQKNTGFLIWLGYNYMTPVTSVAGGLYAIWQNLYNSWELYQKEQGKL
jgi:BASS family bile acid:Na+ symporter